MPIKSLLPLALSCFFMSNAMADVIESGQMTFTPKDAAKCTSSSPTLYVPYSRLTLDVSKATSPIKFKSDQLSLSIYERCEMGRYAPPCKRFCGDVQGQLANASPILVPVRRAVQEIYFSKIKNNAWHCYKYAEERIEVDFLGQTLVDVMSKAPEEEVSMTHCPDVRR